jgi:hypothetical protein
VKRSLSEHARNPWTWIVASFLIVGVGLSISAAGGGKIVRVADAATINHTTSCIPIMERKQDGSPSGRVTCATEAQVIAFCRAAIAVHEGR